MPRPLPTAARSTPRLALRPFHRRDADPLALIERRAELGLRPGGFGILVTKQVVDEMFYNERGNEVLLIKRVR